MNMQWTGVLLILIGCGGAGFTAARCYREEISAMQQLLRALNHMEWELQYHMTPLPDLCISSSETISGPVHAILAQMGAVLSQAEHTDAKEAMTYVLSMHKVPHRTGKYLMELGATLGKYGLQGQVQSLRILRAACEEELKKLESGKKEQIRSYQALALCAGAAIAIIMI